MPLSLAPEEMDVLRALSEPIDQRRRTEFMAEATRRIEEASPRGGVGPASCIGSDGRRNGTISTRRWTFVRIGSGHEGLELNDKSGRVLADRAAGPEAGRRRNKG
jgi:hypothetical protein